MSGECCRNYGSALLLMCSLSVYNAAKRSQVELFAVRLLEPQPRHGHRQIPLQITTGDNYRNVRIPCDEMWEELTPFGNELGYLWPHGSLHILQLSCSSFDL